MNPTQYELATLAAAFSQIQDPSAKVSAAMDVWAAAGKRLQQIQDQEAQVSKHAENYAKQRDEFMAGIEFPPGAVKLELFLAKTMPGRKGPDQMRIFREFLSVPNPAIPEGVEALSRIRENGIGDAYVRGFALVFRRWLASYDQKNRKMKAALGGKARHSKAGSSPHQKKSFVAKSSPKSASSKKTRGPS